MSLPWFYLIILGVCLILMLAGIRERHEPKHKGRKP